MLFNFAAILNLVQKNGAKSCDVLIFTATFAAFRYSRRIDVRGKVCGVKTQKTEEIQDKLGKLGFGRKSRKTMIAGQPG